jgi:hypothetical protein
MFMHMPIIFDLRSKHKSTIYYTITVGDKIICTVDGEQVQAQEGDFYGGWITKDIVGPFKDGAGTWGGDVDHPLRCATF